MEKVKNVDPEACVSLQQVQSETGEEFPGVRDSFDWRNPPPTDDPDDWFPLGFF
jgi:hypothetical protein